jgi:hypothetical protein
VRSLERAKGTVVESTAASVQWDSSQLPGDLRAVVATNRAAYGDTPQEQGNATEEILSVLHEFGLIRPSTSSDVSLQVSKLLVVSMQMSCLAAATVLASHILFPEEWKGSTHKALDVLHERSQDGCAVTPRSLSTIHSAIANRASKKETTLTPLGILLQHGNFNGSFTELSPLTFGGKLSIHALNSKVVLTAICCSSFPMGIVKHGSSSAVSLEDKEPVVMQELAVQINPGASSGIECTPQTFAFLRKSDGVCQLSAAVHPVMLLFGTPPHQLERVDEAPQVMVIRKVLPIAVDQEHAEYVTQLHKEFYACMCNGQRIDTGPDGFLALLMKICEAHLRVPFPSEKNPAQFQTVHLSFREIV